MMKRKLLLLVCAVLTSVSMSADVDITSYLGDISTYSNGGWINPCQNNHTSTNDGAWWNTQTLTGGHSFRYLNGAYESWTESAGTAGVVMGRTITLPTGSYNLSFKAVGTSQSGNTTANDVVAFCTGKENISISTTGEKDYNTKYDVSFDFEITGESATIQFGIKKLSNESTYNWFTLDELVLKFKTTSTDQTSLITNPDFSDATWGNGWSGTGTDKTKEFVKKTGGSSFDGNCAEMYGKSLTAADLKQTITNLPAGIYTLLAKVKAGITCSLYASIGGKEQKHSCLSDLSVQKLSFIVSKTSDVTIGLKHAGYSSNTDNAWIAVDGFKLLRVGDVDETELTSQIANWDFMDCEGAWGVETKFPGWDVSNPNSGNAWRNSATTVEYWIASASSGSFDYYQSVTGLPNGKYTLSASMWNSTNSEGGTASVGGECGVYGTSSHGTVFKGVTDDCDNTNLHTYTTNGILVTDGTLRVGVKNDKTMKARWFGVDWIKLTYLGNNVSLYDPTSFSSNTSATSGTWYAFTVESEGYYRINSSEAATLYYTQDDSKDADATDSKAFLKDGYAFMELNEGTFYFKTSATSTIKIEAVGSGVLQDGDVVTNVFISNPSFEDGDMTMWSLDGVFTRQSESALTGKTGDYYAGSSVTNQTKSISQNLRGLPAGNYILQVRAKAAKYNASSSFDHANVVMGGNSTPVRYDIEDDYTVAYNAASDDASASISFGGKINDYGYFYCDNFTLTYYSTLPAVSGVDDLLAEPMAADVRATLDAANTAYSSEKTVANYNALQTAIINAKNSIAVFAANTDTDADWTSVITNHSFETENTTGWSYTTSDDHGAKRNDNSTYTMSNVDGNYLFNIWSKGNPISQTLKNLPAGSYKLTAVMGTDAGSTFYLKMGDETGIASSVDKGTGVTVTVYTKLDAKGDLTISADAGGSKWYKVDNFQLTYNPSLPASLTAVDGKMNSDVEDAQTTAVAAYNATSGQTIANLLAAQDAIYAANQSVLVYNNITTIKDTYDDKAESLDAAGQAAYTAATNAVSEGAYTQYEEGTYTTAAQAETAYHRDYVTAVKAQATDESDMTDVIVNPSFETGSTTGWSVNYGTGGSHNSDEIKSGNLAEGGGNYYFKSWRASSTSGYVYQTISLPAGSYSLSALVCGNTGTDALVFVKAGNNETTEDVSTAWSVSRLSVDFEMTTAGNITISAGCRNSNEYHADDFKLTFKNANKATIIANNGDITSLINGEFTDNTNGWEGGNHVTGLARSWRSGDVVNNFMERTSSGDMTCTLSKMPAGTYKVVAAARASSGCKITPQIAGTSGATLTGAGDTRNANSPASEINLNGVQMPYNSLGGFTTNAWGHNWQWITATGTLSDAGDLVINFNCNGNSWMPIDDVHLYCTELDGTSYTQTLGTISSNTSVTNTGDASVVTCDLVMSNPNAIISSNAAINGATGSQINNNLVSGTVANLVLYDGYEFSADEDFTATDAKLYRSIDVPDREGAYKYVTICAPFAISGGVTGTFYQPSDLSDGVLSFESTTPEAGKAYLLKATTEDVNTITGSGTVKASPVDNGTDVTMKGVYTNGSVPVSGDGILYYLLNNNQLRKVTSNNATYIPFRAYFKLDETTSGARSTISLKFDDETTGVIATLNEEGETTNDKVVYNLNGQRVKNPAKGLYIVNGKKVMIK